MELSTKRLYVKTKIIVKDGTIEPFEETQSKNSTKTNSILNIQPNDHHDSAFVFYQNGTETEICHIGILDLDGKFELSYGTELAYRKMGFMSEALAWLLDYLKEHRVTDIYARINSDNDTSQNLLEKNEFKVINNNSSKPGILYERIV